MKPDLNDEVKRLHKIYCQLTRYDYPIPLNRYYLWEHFIARKFTDSDLRLVINSMNRGIQNQERREGCLRLFNLIGDLDTFDEELAMARKVFRPKPAYPAAKAQVLRATRRHDEPQQPDAQSAAVVFERTKLAAMLSAWRSANL